MEVDIRTKSYAFAMPCYDGKMVMDTAVSLIQAAGILASSGVNYTLLINASGSLIDASRNDLVHRFLTETQEDILIFIDSDITFNFEGLSRLMARAHTHPIVCGAYPTKEPVSKFIVNCANRQVNAEGLIPINSMGIGFTAVTRQALEQMQPFLQQYRFAAETYLQHAYFKLTIENEQYVGEDIYFFNKAKEAGIQPMLDPYIALGHVGSKNYNTPFTATLGDI